MLFQLLLNSLIAGSTYFLMAIGFSVIYSTLRFFHLAHGAVYTLGAYTFYAVLLAIGLPHTGLGIPIWAYGMAIFFAVIIASVGGVLIDRFVYKPLRKKRSSDLILLLSSFGVFIFIQNLIALIFGNQLLIIRTPIKPGYHILDAVITPNQILIIISTIMVFLFIIIITHHTKMGKAMRAVADDPLTASIVGINPEKVILFAFVLGSGLTGLAGSLVSLEATTLAPTIGFNALLKGIIAVIIGGVGSLTGVLLGSFFLAFSENIAISFLPAGWKDAIAFTIFLLFLLYRPQGILGDKEERAG